jgi:radical SAM superfamily enzyme YgiQ (UPF0313 family)
MIYPEFPDTFWSFKHALKFIHKHASLPPLGLITVAALLPAGWQVKLVDLNIAKLTDSDLAWADYAFISAMVVQRASTFRIVERCKAAGLKVVAGGPLFTAEHEQFPDVDHFILNEAEVSLPLFLQDLAAGSLQRIYNVPGMPDLHHTPVPRWDLLDLKGYASMAIQFSRGCPYDCEFCNITALFGHKPRVKSAAQMIQEVDGLYQLGWRGAVFFVDDNLIGNKRYLKENLLPALIEWRRGKKGMPFNTEVSINLADDDELLNLMVEAGFDTVFIGVETPEDASLAECGKKHNRNRDLVQDIKRIQRRGIQVQGGFIIGFDSDTPSIFQNQIEFIQRSGIVTAMVGLLQAPIGTRLYERLKRQDRLVGNSSGDNVDGTTNIIPMMSSELLHRGYQSVVDYLYTPKNYYARIKTFLKEYQPPRFSVPINFTYVMAFFRSVLRLGILGRERLQYWRLLLWTLFTRPKLFPLSVTLSIYGYHFRRVCELHIAQIQSGQRKLEQLLSKDPRPANSPGAH